MGLLTHSALGWVLSCFWGPETRIRPSQVWDGPPSPKSSPPDDLGSKRFTNSTSFIPHTKPQPNSGVHLCYTSHLCSLGHTRHLPDVSRGEHTRQDQEYTRLTGYQAAACISSSLCRPQASGVLLTPAADSRNDDDVRQEKLAALAAMVIGVQPYELPKCIPRASRALVETARYSLAGFMMFWRAVQQFNRDTSEAQSSCW